MKNAIIELKRENLATRVQEAKSNYEQGLTKSGDFPVAEKVAAQCLSLPMSPYISQEDQERVVKAMGDGQ